MAGKCGHFTQLTNRPTVREPICSKPSTVHGHAAMILTARICNGASWFMDCHKSNCKLRRGLSATPFVNLCYQVEWNKLPSRYSKDSIILHAIAMSVYHSSGTYTYIDTYTHGQSRSFKLVRVLNIQSVDTHRRTLWCRLSPMHCNIHCCNIRCVYSSARSKTL